MSSGWPAHGERAPHSSSSSSRGHGVRGAANGTSGHGEAPVEATERRKRGAGNSSDAAIGFRQRVISSMDGSESASVQLAHKGARRAGPAGLSSPTSSSSAGRALVLTGQGNSTRTATTTDSDQGAGPGQPSVDVTARHYNARTNGTLVTPGPTDSSMQSAGSSAMRANENAVAGLFAGVPGLSPTGSPAPAPAPGQSTGRGEAPAAGSGASGSRPSTRDSPAAGQRQAQGRNKAGRLSIDVDGPIGSTVGHSSVPGLAIGVPTSTRSDTGLAPRGTGVLEAKPGRAPLA